MSPTGRPEGERKEEFASMNLPSVLLVEPQFVLRRTIGAVARDLGVADIREATSVDGAIAVLAVRPCDLLVLDVSDEGAARRLLTRLRRGELACAADTSVIALGTGDAAALALRLADLGVHRVMRKPLKISALLDAVRAAWAGRAAAETAAAPALAS